MLTATILSFLITAAPAAPVHGTYSDSHVRPDTALQQPVPSQEFISKEGRFRIMIPGGYSRPTLEVSDVASDLGKIKLYMYTSYQESESACFIGYSDIKGVELSTELKSKMLDGAREGALKGMNAILDSETVIAVNGHPGRSIHFSADKEGEKMQGRFDYYIVDNRMYQIGFLAMNGAVLESESTTMFFRSFTLVKAQPVRSTRRKRR